MISPRKNILLADDDVAFATMLKQYLEGEGFHVSTAHDGGEALRLLDANAYDLLVLDVMMPILSGLDVLRELRKHSSLPVLMLTARGEDVDSIVGLELGADDYLSKPCNPRVLVARMQALLRRADNTKSENVGADDHKNLRIGDVELNRGQRQVLIQDSRIDLTSTEYSVIEILLTHAGDVVSKEDISLHALGRKPGAYDRSIDMHVSKIRKKIGALPNGDERIKTVRGQGYQYVLS